MSPEPRDPSESSSDSSTSASLFSWSSFSRNGRSLILALALALLVRVLVAEPRYIPSDSMMPTLQVRDRLVVEKVSYRLHDPNPGDIVVFQPPPQLQTQGFRANQAFIKRIIGLPGQRVEVRQGVVYVNSYALTEPYIAEPPEYEFGPLTVPADQYFVMGDNRNNSNDSHIWGFLPKDNIIGRATLRFWPLERISFIQAPSLP